MLISRTIGTYSTYKCRTRGSFLPLSLSLGMRKCKDFPKAEKVAKTKNLRIMHAHVQKPSQILSLMHLNTKRKRRPYS